MKHNLKQIILQLAEQTELYKFNNDLAVLQRLIGVTTGDLAGWYFDEYSDCNYMSELWINLSKVERITVLNKYIQKELSQLLEI